MAVFNKFESFAEAVMEGIHDLGADTLKVMLSNTAPNATFTDTSDVTEITPENGYELGGSTVTVTDSSETGGTYSLIANDLVFTAASGTIGPFQYVILYNDDAPSDELIGWWDYGSSVTLQSGETFTVDLDQTGGAWTLS